MSKRTNISWCDSSSNAVIGCTKVSAGCKECYAAIDTPARVLRHRGIETWGDSGQRVLVKGFEKSMLAMNRKQWICDECGHAQEWQEIDSYEHVGCSKCGTTTHRRRTFCDSNSDWLDEKWPIETLAHFLDVCRRCPDMILILCTKRPENWEQRMRQALHWLQDHTPLKDIEDAWLHDWVECGKAPANVILLASVENQEAADTRIPELLRIPAACRGLSLEPLLGPVDLKLKKKNPSHSEICECGHSKQWHDCGRGRCDVIPQGGLRCGCRKFKDSTFNEGTGIDWLIIGGESGTNARPCNVDWIRSLVAQVKAAGLATFVKQLGENPFGILADPSTPRVACGPITDKKGGDPSEWPADLRVQEWPKGF